MISIRNIQQIHIGEAQITEDPVSLFSMDQLLRQYPLVGAFQIS